MNKKQVKTLQVAEQKISRVLDELDAIENKHGSKDHYCTTRQVNWIRVQLKELLEGVSNEQN